MFLKAEVASPLDPKLLPVLIIHCNTSSLCTHAFMIQGLHLQPLLSNNLFKERNTWERKVPLNYPIHYWCTQHGTIQILKFPRIANLPLKNDAVWLPGPPFSEKKSAFWHLFEPSLGLVAISNVMKDKTKASTPGKDWPLSLCFVVICGHTKSCPKLEVGAPIDANEKYGT